MYQSVGVIMESHFTLKAQLTRANFLQNFFSAHVDTKICDLFLFINALLKWEFQFSLFKENWLNLECVHAGKLARKFVKDA